MPKLSWPKRPFLFALLLFAVSRLLVFGVFVAYDVATEDNIDTLEQRLLTYVHRWDSGYYRVIAQSGYRVSEATYVDGRSNIVFYPLLPLLARGVSEISGLHVSLAGALVTNLSFLAALWLFLVYATNRADAAVARRGAALLAFCPQSFSFSVFYTESVFLALALAAIVAFDSRRFAWSSAAAALLSGVRANGIFVAAYFGIHLLSFSWSHWRKRLPWADYWREASRLALPILFTPLGLFVFWWFCFHLTGDAFAQKSAGLHGWAVGVGTPFKLVFTHFGSSAKNTFWICSALFYLASSLTLLRYRLFGDVAFAVANLTLYLSNFRPDSLLRYSIVIFPAYLALALLTRRQPAWYVVLLIVFVGLNIFLCYAWMRGLHVAI